MAAIMIGSFLVPLRTDSNAIRKFPLIGKVSQKAKTVGEVFHTSRIFAKHAIQKYDTELAAAWKTLPQRFQHKEEKVPSLQLEDGFTLVKRKKSVRAHTNIHAENIKTPITTTCIKEEPGIQETLKCLYVRSKNDMHTRKKAQKPKSVKGSTALINSLTRFVSKLSAKRMTQINIICKRQVRIKYGLIQGVKRPCVAVRHLSGIKRKVDCVLENFHTQTLRNISDARMIRRTFDADSFDRGASGFVIPIKSITGNLGRSYDDMFIVRGRCDNRLLDARSKLNFGTMSRMIHYSDHAHNFWKGFSTTFMANRPVVIDHECASDFHVETCGVVAALMCQTLIPCGKITCSKCALSYSRLSFTEMRDLVTATLERNSKVIEEHYPQFVNVKTFLMNFQKAINSINPNYDAFREIKLLIGERTEAPFSFVNKINDVLIKGGLASQDDLTEASTQLLQIARFLKNRTENIKAGSLHSFRNKISSKAHINTALLCDNQLDKNGNFIWGERGYHAKRFFSNYFEIINPRSGYSQYIERRNPNGVRKLAIGNLIISTNLATLREQMRGEPIEKLELSIACVSKRNESFVYPCSCVTFDNGQPMESDIRMPTKNHLVIGNSGDAKYIDLPQDVNMQLYIAKEGYCYINIFLAMLVNVSEQDAKNFTKMVRDIIVDKLGTWPSMLDVATCCHMLTVFFPDTLNAELPRILVDHKTKTMHVVDSYGSLSTGYHILKANTVTQLVQFASYSLDSEMKHYIVGGLVNNQDTSRASLRVLMRGIYSPKTMQEILETEPYLLILSILSPGVLLALFNSGALERAVRSVISKHQDLAMITLLLSSLAHKVSLAKTFNAQMCLMNEHAQLFLEILERPTVQAHSHAQVVTALQCIISANESDKTLIDVGFSTLRTQTAHIMEKSYLADLQECWDELGLFGQCRAIYASRKWRGYVSNILHPTKTADLNGRYDISLKSFVGEKVSKLQSHTTQAIYKVTNLRFCVYRYARNAIASSMYYLIPDMLQFLSLVYVFSILLGIFKTLHSVALKHRTQKEMLKYYEQVNAEKQVVKIYKQLKLKLGQEPTQQEFIEYLDAINPALKEVSENMLELHTSVTHQAKRPSELNLERMVAFVSLILMMFDAEKSDCTYKVLTKLKNLMYSIDVDVHHQSLDEIRSELEEKNFTVDFEMESPDALVGQNSDKTFAQWWQAQLSHGNTIPHYRTEGHFMEFTRQNAAKVANDIAHGPQTDILLRGAVGSGKSTGLPFHLSSKGKVLLLEPTRPLAENVSKQLRNEPFHVNPTLRMRGMSSFGSAPITIMTSGFALHYFANNPNQIKDYAFIIIDECHVSDAQAMAFRCLLQEYTYEGKLIKVSATPPGREVEFTTQFPVQVIVEEALSFKTFVDAQGTGVNCDVISKGDNILVYVASYNEVDQLSKLLLDKKHKVTKIDGRTMKLGNVEIVTSGTPSLKHFIVATNIIENGVTLDIDVVVDFGVKVVPSFDLDNRRIMCTKCPISYGERIQRLGRVGRHKRGTALRIGWTEKGLIEINPVVATEAAFLCFTYGLPVMTSNVSVSVLSQCTVRQARTMQNFELSPFYTAHLIRYDGTIHHAIHNLLRPYKLRDSEIALSKLAIPSGSTSTWLTAATYSQIGIVNSLERDVRIPFHIHEIPERLHNEIWKAINQYKHDAGFRKLDLASSTKIAYTLQTDLLAIPRTIKILDHLIEQEMMKQAHFQAISNNCCSISNLTLMNITNSIRSKYMKDHTQENIGVLQAVKAQLLEFKNINSDASIGTLPTTYLARDIQQFGALDSVHHQSTQSLVKHLQLKGIWNKSLITRDIVIMLGVLGGGAWMLYSHFITNFNERVQHQGYNKRQRQKLKFRQARESKVGKEVYGDDGTIEHYFGSSYTKKGKTKGTARGMGVKSRKFVNMYGYDPADYSFVRFVDPLTGYTIDEHPLTDVTLATTHLLRVRQDMIVNDELEPQALNAGKMLTAYYVNNLTKAALKVDLTPHNPLAVCNRSNTIAGFPEREFEARQTGAAIKISIAQVPQANERDVTDAPVEHESQALLRGVRDYNPIASSICQLTNTSDGYETSIFGLGYGGLIITNQHLFKRNNGELLIKSRHGEFLVRNTGTLKLLPCEKRDIVLIQLPKDCPPFPQKLKFRIPEINERVCLIGSLFQEKSISSTVSETSTTYPVNDSHFWKHWISTKDGHCGLPIVSTKDGYILGLHSLANTMNANNYFAAFPENFNSQWLDTIHQAEWIKQWKYNPDMVSWGPLRLKESAPDGLFKTSKLIQDLNAEIVMSQSKENKWMYEALKGNLKAVASCPSQLVTKHVVKGKCLLFETFLQVDEEANRFFAPMRGAYQKSRLNREAYIKDIMKYSSPIVLNEVDHDCFEDTVVNFIEDLKSWGFSVCNYVTDTESIFTSLNMKSAVGALYSGKKRDYFETFTDDDKDNILFESCKRLFCGKLGVWNGSLKSELRTIEKVSQNKTRTFTAAPIDTLLGGKVCVDDFNNTFYSLNLKAPWTVGMTKFYGGWNELLTALPDNWVYCDADGSQFDSSLSPYLINAVLNIRLNFMEEWDVGRQMLQNLYTEIVYTPISTPDGTVVKKFKGNNSGQPSTVVDNTLMVVIAMKYSLSKLGIPPNEQENMITYFVNGDDLLIAIDPEYVDILDSFSLMFATLGLKYDFSNRTKNKTDLWFMSHCGIKAENMYIPKLEPERIVSILEWDRSSEPQHRLEAICAAMIESWGYKELIHQIRRFYSWVLEQAPYNELAKQGKAPYIAETALKRLYTSTEPTNDELEEYIKALYNMHQTDDICDDVMHQADETLDAGAEAERKKKKDDRGKSEATSSQEIKPRARDEDVNVGTPGKYTVPKIKPISSKISLPKIRGKEVLDLTHLLEYNPEQVDISNTRATQRQFDNWYDAVKDIYEVSDAEMSIILNGFMVWCIENGTSPNINGTWVMMEGDEQREFKLQPIIENAKPTLRQIMAHFSNVAEAYIEKRNYERPYMPRYGLQRNLTDMSLARYAFDFYEINSKTPARAREAHFQMKAAALRGVKTRLFGLDGNVGDKEEDTERHTTDDVNRNMHNLLGMRGV